MKFDMRGPCAHCPFRSDIPGYLHPERAQEILDSLLADESFPCHNTVDYDKAGYDDEGCITHYTAGQHCAGAMILMKHLGRMGQLARIAMRLGFYNPDHLDMDAPVFKTGEEFVAHHGEEHIAAAIEVSG